MRKFILPILLLHFAMAANAATYYFSTSAGDDSRTSDDAQSPSTPWKTIDKLNAIMYMLRPGDQVLFKRGDIFNGGIVITISGTSNAPITFGDYGGGYKPIISGFTAISDWTQVRNKVWEASFWQPTGKENMVVMNNEQQPIGRYPNADDSNSGYLTIDSHSGLTQLTSSQLPAYPNWTGAEIAIRKNRWVIDRSLVTSHSGNTIGFESASNNDITDKFGFFIQNHTNTLDQNGEWFYDKNRSKLQMYFDDNNPNGYGVRGSTVETLVTIKFQNYIIFDNLTFSGANSNAFSLTNSNNITVNSCILKYSGIDAIIALSSNYFTLTNSIINKSNNNGIYMYWNCNNTLISDNTVKNTAVIAGMAQSSTGTHQGIVVFGNNNLIQNNEVDSSGSNGIHFEGDYSTVKNNFVNTFGFTVDDCSGIYTGQGDEISTIYNSKSIIGNIVLNGIGAVDGTDNKSYIATQGIYLDANTNHVAVTDNTVANSGQSGIFSNNSFDINIANNTMYNNGKEQFLGVRNANPISDVTVTGNIMFSKDASQLVTKLESYSGKNDINQFGTLNNNYYCRPLDNNYIFYDMYTLGNTYYTSYENLSSWQSKFGFDSKSKGAPATIPAFIYSSTSDVNRYANGSFNQNVNDVGSYSSTGDMNTVWNANKLDGGTLQVSANNYSSSNNFMITLPTGTSVTAGKTYLLTFSLQGSNNSGRPMDVYLRDQDAPNSDISTRYKIPITNDRQDLQFGFTVTSSKRVSIELDVSQPNGTIWIDNVVLQDATITPTDPDDYMLFKYNETKNTKTFTLDDTYYDAKGATYSGKVTLQPYTSLVLFKQSGTTQTTSKIAINAPQAITLQGNLVDASATSVASTSSASVSWQVDNQTSNASYYEVERSSDAVNFTTIEKASVKTGAAAIYQYKDASPLGGKNYYRIRQYNEKGVAAISKIILINNIGFKINPNPAKDVLHLFFDQPLNATDNIGKDVVIRNMTGLTVKKIQLPPANNLSRADINVSTLKSGMYMLSITSEGKAISRTFIKE